MRMPRPTYANVMSTIAVFLALGGTSYAVAKLPKGSVTSRELKAGAVTEPKLARGAVTGAAVKDGSLSGADLAPGSVPAGPRGPRGAEGKDGAPGASAGETILGTAAANGEFVQFPTPADSWTALATAVLPAGAWNLDAQTRLQWDPSTVRSVWSDCDLITASGELLSRGSAYVGNDAEGSITQIVPMATAVTFPSATKVTFGCRHQHTIEPGLGAVQTSLRATRVARVERQ